MILKKMLYAQDFISFDEIKLINECSLQTVYNDVEFIEEQWGGVLSIESINNQIKASHKSFSDYLEIEASLLRDEILVQLLFSIYTDNKFTIRKFQSNNYYSSTHIRNQIQVLDECLHEIDCSISVNKETGEYKIVAGDLERLIFNLLHFHIIIFGHEEIGDTNYSCVDQLLNEYNLILDNNHIVELHLYFYYLSFIEINPCDKFEQQIIKLNLIYDKNKNIIIDLLDKYNFEFDREELNQIVSILMVISFKAQAFNNIKPEYEDLNRYRFFYSNFKKMDVHIINMIESDLRILSNLFQLNLYDYREEFVFYAYTLLPEIRTYKKYRIGVFSDFSVSHSESTIAYLNRYFPNQNFELFTENSDFDFVISNSHSLLSTNYIEKIIYVGDLINENDIYNIYRQLFLKG